MWLLCYKESIAPTFFGILKKSLISFSTVPAWFLGRMLIITLYDFCICMDSAFMGRSTPTTAFDGAIWYSEDTM